MAKCLTKAESQKLIDLCANTYKIDNEDGFFWIVIENSRNWEYELTLLTYLLSKILERKKNRGENCLSLLNLAYNLQNYMWLSIQEFDVRFIEYLVRSERDRTLSLEERLIELQDDFSEHIYGESFRPRY
jgi:hypothetical protein